MSRLECADEEGKRFLDEEFLCGVERTGPCFCGGALQNSWQTLVEHFGACDQ
jgi:hypothetical protein